MLSAAVLAGGRSSRLGYPKALLRLGSGTTLIEDTVAKLRRLADDVTIVANDDIFAVPGVRRVSDVVPGAASLGGIYTAVATARHDRVIVVGCDMPFLSTRLVAYLLTVTPDADVVVPRLDGYPEPLHAIYRRTCLGPMRRRIDRGELRIIGFFADVRVSYVDESDLRRIDPELRSFRNVNTRAAVVEARALVDRLGPAILRD